MERELLRVGLIGYGAIGQDIARLLAKQAEGTVFLIGALVRHAPQSRSSGPPLMTSLTELLAKQPEVIVEVAGHEGVREHGPHILRAGINLILTSIGALAEPQVLQELLEAAQTGGAHIKIASGAIGGLDALASASVGGLTSVIHTLRKPPHTLLLPEEAAHLKSAREIFQGSARQAVQRYPQFLNVAAAVALAGKGFDDTVVRVIADPNVEYSLHEVQARGVFGTFRFEIQNDPVIHSSRGARLVAMSIVHILLQQRLSLFIG